MLFVVVVVGNDFVVCYCRQVVAELANRVTGLEYQVWWGSTMVLILMMALIMVVRWRVNAMKRVILKRVIMRVILMRVIMRVLLMRVIMRLMLIRDYH